MAEYLSHLLLFYQVHERGSGSDTETELDLVLGFGRTALQVSGKFTATQRWLQ